MLRPRNPISGPLMSSTKRAALYVRVSTDSQTVENQIRELRQVAERRGWEVVGVYNDAGISGAKGRCWVLAMLLSPGFPYMAPEPRRRHPLMATASMAPLP